MPSEQAQGRPRPASDVYAVGKIAIRLLTGREPDVIPENPHTGELLWQGLASEISQDFVRVINKMISYHFKDRYKDASEVLKAVLNLKAKIQPNMPFPPPGNISPFLPGQAFPLPKVVPPQVAVTPKVPLKPRVKSPNLNVEKNKIQWAVDLLGFPWEHQTKEVSPNFSLNFPLYLILYSLGYSVLGFIGYGFMAIGATQFSIGFILFLVLGISICGAIPDFRQYVYMMGLCVALFLGMIAWYIRSPINVILAILLIVLIFIWCFVVTLGNEDWKFDNLFRQEILVRSLLALPGIFAGLGLGMLLTLLHG